MTRNQIAQADRRRRYRRGGLAALATAATLAGGLTFASAAAARGARPAGVKPTTIVKEADRSVAGQGSVELLTTTKGATLYVDDSPPCTKASGCLAVWPPLLLPKGKTVPGGPTGLTGLGTTPSPSGHGRLQVTYNSLPLYTFTGGSAKGTTGNGQGGFYVAAVSVGAGS